jgi:hypothetical protein
MRRMFIKNIVSFLRDRLNKLRVILTGIFYGMSAYELELELRKEQGYLNNLFTAMIFGDMAGLPIFPPYYSLRLLPYIIPHIASWKRSILRERDLTDVISNDL